MFDHYKRLMAINEILKEVDQQLPAKFKTVFVTPELLAHFFFSTPKGRAFRIESDLPDTAKHRYTLLDHRQTDGGLIMVYEDESFEEVTTDDYMLWPRAYPAVAGIELNG